MAERGLTVRNNQHGNRLVRQTGKSNLHDNGKPSAVHKPPLQPRPVKPSIPSKGAPPSFEVYEDPASPTLENPIDENNVIHLLEKKCREEKLKNAVHVKRSIQRTNRRPLAPLGESKIENRQDSDEDDLYSARSHATDASVRNDLLLLDFDDIKAPIQPHEDDSEDFKSIPEEDLQYRADCLYGAPSFDENIYEYMCMRETKVRPRPDFLRRQKEITGDMRHILIDWLSDVVVEYNMCQETLHLAISLVDRSLSRFLVQRDKLQLIGATALMIAAKFEEIYPPETKDYIYMTDDTYEIKHLLLMERAVLKELNFDVSVPTAAWFANRITHFVPIAETTRFAMEYMLDLTLLDTEYLEFKPSYVAAACLCYANLLCGEEAWSKQNEECTGIRLEHLKKACLKLHNSFANAPNATHRAIYTHYSELLKHEVSNMTPPSNLPFDI